jgi:[acyl-carrier-protein] S-malonyltransferase
MIRALMFPGQGSQAVGMGRDLAAGFATARLTFEEVDEALGQHLSRIMFEGPEETLTLTENAQPALMAVSLAVMRVLERDGGLDVKRKIAFVAGHSLGEYSALAAAQAFSLADTARLLKRRGLAMQRAVPVGEGAMAALLGMEIEDARKVAADAAQGQVCDCANDNGPGQVVVSGNKAAVERAVKIAAERGARRAIMLPVSAPFHCALLAPAAREMEEALAAVELREPVVPLIANVSASAEREPDEIRRLLVEQVTGRVRWRESMLALKGLGVDVTVEMGGSKVLTAMVKRIDKDLQSITLDTPDEIEAFAKTL